MYKLHLFAIALSIAIAVGCGCDDTSRPTRTASGLTLTCPSDTVIPINEPADPDSTGLVPDAETHCMDEPTVSYSDSSLVGGLMRTWIAADTCGNADTCIQFIGLGAPAFKIRCPPDTVRPINCPVHPDSLGLYPQVEGSCMAQPLVNFADSFITGGIVRTWIASDTCGNADTCIQGIGQGAPGPCN